MAILHVRPSSRKIVRKLGVGFLEVYSSPLGDLPVLHVAGTHEQMGRQYGALVGDLIRQNVDMTIGLYAKSGVPVDIVLRILDMAWARLSPHVSPQVLAEIDSVAAGAQSAGFDITAEDVRRIVAVTNLDMYRRDERLAEMLSSAPPQSCTFFAAWGPRTDGGKLLASRNLDWVSQTGMHQTRLVTVYRPEGGFGYVTLGYAGLVGALAGMNEKGICFSEIGAFSGSEELDGTPWILTARKVLEETGVLDDAINVVLAAKNTIGYNLMTAYGDSGNYGSAKYAPGAAAFETNFTCCEMFRDDDPKEHSASWRGRPYGLPLKHAVMRGDMAFSPSVRALQATDNGIVVPGNDGNPFTAATYVDCHKPMYDMFRAYESGAEYVYPLRNTRVIEAGPPRLIGREEALNIAATVAHNVEKLDRNDWNVMSVVYAPTDLEFYVAYESKDSAGNWRNAPDAGYWQFSLRDLLV